MRNRSERLENFNLKFIDYSTLLLFMKNVSDSQISRLMPIREFLWSRETPKWPFWLWSAFILRPSPGANFSKYSELDMRSHSLSRPLLPKLIQKQKNQLKRVTPSQVRLGFLLFLKSCLLRLVLSMKKSFMKPMKRLPPSKSYFPISLLI